MAQITVIRSTPSVAPKGYEIVELAYKTDDGKTKGMKIMGFGEQKALIPVAKAAQPGDVLEAGFAQNDKGFWQFTSLANTGRKADAPSTSAAPVANSGASRGNWETPDERAARQLMIVRQNALTNAIAYRAAMEPKGLTVDVATIVATAQAFEEYTSGKVAVTGDVA